MKYELEVVKAYEVVTPASRMIYSNMLTGEKTDSGIDIPATLHLYAIGHRYTARNAKDARRLLATGNWKENR